LMDFVAYIERALGRTATKNFVALQSGDILATYADVADLESAVGFKPKTSLEEGIRHFVEWYRDYYRV
jgi:UDP-glucuronate 4-epimerase